MVREACDQLAKDESIQGSLTARGYVQLLDWASDRAYRVAECIGPGIEVSNGVVVVSSLLGGVLRAAVRAAEASDTTDLVRELISCPRPVIDRELAVAALARLPMNDGPDGNAEAIAAALRAATTEDQP